MRFFSRTIPFICTLLLLSACGGGGGSSSKTNTPDTAPIVTNKAPVIGASNVEVETETNLSLSAQATDSDGTITSYLWTQKSGETVTISSNNDETLSFTTPTVSVEQSLIFDLTVTDNDGVSTTKEIVIVVVPKSMSLSISGKVSTSKNVLANVPVIISYGESSYSTKTNELGNYTIELGGITSSQHDKIVRITATGEAQDSVVKLVSYVDELSTLISLAEQHDGLLSVNENSRLAVSSVSTAIAALLEQANNGAEVSSMALHNEHVKSINPDIVLNYAAMFDYLIEAIDGSYDQLPASLKEDGFNNIYDLFTDQQTATKLYYEIGKDRLNIESFYMDVSASQGLSSGLTTFNNEQQEKHLVTRLGTISLNANQTGQISNNSLGNMRVTWEVTDNVTQVTLTTPFADPSYASTQDTEEYGYIQVNRVLESYSLYNLYDSQALNLLLIKPNYTYRQTVSNEPVTVNIDDNFVPYSAFNLSNRLSLADRILSQKQYALSLSHPKPKTFVDYTGSDFEALIVAMTLDFTSNSEVYITMDSTNDIAEFSETAQKASWTIDDSGVLFINNDQWTIDVTGLIFNNSVNSEVFVNATYKEGAETFQTNELTYLDLMSDEPHQWSNSNVAGIYQYKDEFTNLNPMKTYWYELYENGSVTYYSISDTYSDFPTIDSRDVFESPGLWRIIDGEVVIRRFRYNGAVANQYGRCESTEWETTLTSECILYLERAWKLVTTYTDNGQDHELIRQRTKFNYAFLANSFGEDLSASGTYIASMSSIFSDFIKLNQRPVTLPDDYVPIKNQAKVEISKTFNLEKEKLSSVDSLH